MNYKRRKAVLDDGCCPELVSGADFDGIFEIPILKKPNRIFIPSDIIPFSQREKVVPSQNIAIGFYEMDPKFAEVLISPSNYVMDLSRFGAIITPDSSLYRCAPLIVQVTNIYRNRVIGYFYQRCGLNIIPNIRWGSEETYTTKVFPEKVAFLGIPKHSIVAIGTYGCIQHKDDKYFFKAGLESMLDTLEPATVLVYGAMPTAIFGDYLHTTNFVQYDDWTSKRHGGDN